MSTISVSDLKTHLSREIKQVMKGKNLIVTDHGHPVAKLSPIMPEKNLVVRYATRKMSDFKHSVKVPVKTDPLVFLMEDRLR